MTPLQIAQKWAKDNPDKVGILEVETQTRKGKYGRKGTTRRRNIFFVKASKVAARRSKNWDGENGRERRENGVCWLCKEIFLEPVLQHGYVADPEAGQKNACGQTIYALASVQACPECWQKNGVVSDYGDHPYTPEVAYPRFHPNYNPFWKDLSLGIVCCEE
jgi:hypothetical protein